MEKVTVGTMGSYKVNDKKENIFPARVTWVNPPEKEGDEATVDLMVMVHIEDYPEFSLAECAMGHAHRLGVKVGTIPGTFEPEEEPTISSDPRVDTLVSQVSSLSSAVAALTDKVSKLSAPSA